ncbi:MAG: hypothetical protein AAB578_09420, partial [Elusimicrobiota bacterium]
MSRDDKFALGVLLLLALSIPFFLLHRWSQREYTYSAVGAKPLDSAKSILVNPVPGAEASRGQASPPSRLPSLTLPDAPPGAPAQSASDSAPSAAVEEPPASPEDAAYGSPVSGAPRPSLAMSRSGLPDPGGGGGAAAGGGEEQQASSEGKRAL